MSILNIEFKAKASNLQHAENKLLALNPKFIGEDNQTDTYFNTPSGRLKLREGNIENSLIYYVRNDSPGIKQSEVLLYTHQPEGVLKEILTTIHGVRVIVSKRRRIYFIDNVKFHFDTVAGLGSFIEVEAIDMHGDIGIIKLQEQCNTYKVYLEVAEEDFITGSYSDLLENKSGLDR